MARPLEIAEKRREPREPAHGGVLLRTSGHPLPVSVTGQLIDTSQSGFRALHTWKSLQTGEEVDFDDGRRQGRARVVWLRISQESVETGFYILSTTRPA